MNFDRLNGLVPAVIIDNITNAVLMVGFMNKESLEITNSPVKSLSTAEAEKNYGLKGRTSGNFLHVSRNKKRLR